MTEDQYILQKRKLGLPLHHCDGVWWEKRKPFYFKPAFDRVVVAKGHAAPMRVKALVGFSHMVPDRAEANTSWSFMERRWGTGEVFDLGALTAKKRNQVRKGIKSCDVRVLESLNGLWSDLQRVNISHRNRTGVGKPAEFYSDNYDSWRAYLSKLHRLPYRQWFGAFINGTLASYYYGYSVGETYIIDTAKSDSGFLQANPNDALLFRMMEHAYNVEGCSTVVFGGHTPDDCNLTAFKMKFGFEITEHPVNMWLFPLLRAVACRRRTRTAQK